MPKKRRESAIAFRIGESIRRARKHSGMSQSELSARIGVSHQQVQKYERGATEPTISRLTHIAGALGMPLKGLIDGCVIEAETARPPEDEEKALAFYRKLADKNLGAVAISVLKAISESPGAGG